MKRIQIREERRTAGFLYRPEIKTGLSILLLAVMLMICGAFALAESLSADNSLSSLGITTEGAVISPEFAYGTTVYDVTVPAGTTSLTLDPTPSNSAAYIDSITGTELVDGTATVSIVVVAENGDAYTYYLNVTEEAGAEAETEVQTEAQTETETEEETEDPRYVSAARETLEEAQNTIDALKSETSSYRDRVELLTKILYGLIALCVVLLFVVINLLLKNKDRKAELRAYRGLNYSAAQNQQEDAKADRKEKKSRQKKSKKEKKVVVTEKDSKETEEPYAESVFDSTGRDSFYEPEESVGARMNDDPATVPKPSGAKKQVRQMPEYEPEKERPVYEPSKGSENGGSEVNIDYIDL